MGDAGKTRCDILITGAPCGDEARFVCRLRPTSVTYRRLTIRAS